MFYFHTPLFIQCFASQFQQNTQAWSDVTYAKKYYPGMFSFYFRKIQPWGIFILFIYLLFYVAFNSQGHILTGSLQVGETSAYCTVNHLASSSNYQLSNMKRPTRDSNQRPQRLEARTLTATPPCPLTLSG